MTDDTGPFIAIDPATLQTTPIRDGVDVVFDTSLPPDIFYIKARPDGTSVLYAHSRHRLEWSIWLAEQVRASRRAVDKLIDEARDRNSPSTTSCEPEAFRRMRGAYDAAAALAALATEFRRAARAATQLIADLDYSAASVRMALVRYHSDSWFRARVNSIAQAGVSPRVAAVALLACESEPNTSRTWQVHRAA